MIKARNTDSVVTTIGLWIVQGRFAANEVLPVEAELCEELGVSRTLLRESIKVLMAKGLVEVRRKTGTRALPSTSWQWFDPEVLAWRTSGDQFDKELLRELSDARRIFEPAAAELAAKRADASQIRQLQQLYRTMERASRDSADAFIDADLAFHQHLLVCCKNNFLLQLSATIETALHASRLVTIRRAGSVAGSMSLHEAVVKAIALHDADMARTCMLELIDYTVGDLDAVLSGTAEPPQDLHAAGDENSAPP